MKSALLSYYGYISAVIARQEAIMCIYITSWQLKGNTTDFTCYPAHEFRMSNELQKTKKLGFTTVVISFWKSESIFWHFTAEVLNREKSSNNVPKISALHSQQKKLSQGRYLIQEPFSRYRNFRAMQKLHSVFQKVFKSEWKSKISFDISCIICYQCRA